MFLVLRLMRFGMEGTDCGGQAPAVALLPDRFLKDMFSLFRVIGFARWFPGSFRKVFRTPNKFTPPSITLSQDAADAMRVTHATALPSSHLTVFSRNNHKQLSGS